MLKLALQIYEIKRKLFLTLGIKTYLYNMIDSRFDCISLIPIVIEGASQNIVAANISSTSGLQAAVAQVREKYVLIVNTADPIDISISSVSRMISVAEETDAVLLYADYKEIKGGLAYSHKLIACQPGSLRDDFDFGPVYLVRAEMLRLAAEMMDGELSFAALYDMRLRLMRFGNLFHLPELLYTKQEHDLRSSGRKQFDYVNPRNRDVQIEMEQVFSAHLKSIGAYIEPGYEEKCEYGDNHAVEASVVIPVYNRESTIADAIASAFTQKTSFDYNVIVVDNRSTDNTTTIVRALAAVNPKLVHVVPERTDLGIGGCWNEAINHEKCGRFAVQLDSDDLYSSPDTLQKIIDKFHSENCAMVIGSYSMVDFELQPLPPGLIDHKEWTDENGRNNALRINGLGAPRAFVTDMLRENPFANVSYGEDYAQGLRFSRQYHIGRIYDSLYLCRRWRGNSDAHLDQDKINENNYYKDTVRTIELCSRMKYLAAKRK